MDRPRLKPAVRGAVLGAIVVAAIAIGGCGGGETTVIERRVVESPNFSAPGSAMGRTPALLKLPTYETWTIEPGLYSFGVSGNPAGHDLIWTDWGSPRAEGRGTLWTRRYEGGNNPSDYDKVPATIIATGLERCEGHRFYTRVEAIPDVGAGEGAMELQTPCSGGGEFSPGAIEGPDDGEPEEVQSSPALHPLTFFHTPTGNIGCALNDDSARCDIQRHDWTPPPAPADCNLDWGYGLALSPTGPGHFFCGGDSVFGAGGTLAYGAARTVGDFGCIVRQSGVRCENRATGHGFVLSRQEARGF